MNNKASPLKLALHGMDSRYVKTLMLFLKGPCKGAAVILNTTEDADVDVFDADVPASQKLLANYFQQDLLKPVIVFSLQNFSLEHVLYVKKPVQMDDLLKVLDEAKKLAGALSKKMAELNELVSPQTAENDLFDFFNDELFHYLTSSEWEDDPIPNLPAEKQESIIHANANSEENIAFEPQETPTVLTTSVSLNPAESESPGYEEEDGQEPEFLEPDEGEPDEIEEHASISSVAAESAPKSATVNPGQQTDDIEPLELKMYAIDQERGKTAKHQTAMRLDEKGFHDRIAAIENMDINDLEQCFYQPKDYLQGYIQEALTISRRQNLPMLLQSVWQPITLLPRTQEVWVKSNDSELSIFAGIKLKHKTMETKISLTPIDPGSMNLSIALDKFQNMDAFLWKLACWTSKGRYPQDIDYAQPVYLINWPNFTRLVITPHALRIAALLIQGARTMSNIAEALNIKPQYIYVFISAAHAVGLIGQTQRQSDSLVQSPDIIPSKTQKLLSRIMSKLRK